MQDIYRPTLLYLYTDPFTHQKVFQKSYIDIISFHFNVCYTVPLNNMMTMSSIMEALVAQNDGSQFIQLYF